MDAKKKNISKGFFRFLFEFCKKVLCKLKKSQKFDKTVKNSKFDIFEKL